VVFLLICWLFLGNDPLSGVLGGYGAREFTLGQRLLSETRIVIHYLSLLVLPLPGRLNLAYDYQLSTGLFTPPETLLAIIGLVGLTSLIFSLYKKDRLAAFAIFWLLGNLAVESTFMPLELIFEHRMYLPSMFLILAGVAWLYRLTTSREKTARLIIIGALLLLSLFTWQRNGVWKDTVTLWTDVIQKSPGSVRAHVNLGIAYSEAGQFDKAESFLIKAMELDPDSGFTYLNLGANLEKQERYAEAISIYKKAIGLRKSNPPKLYFNLSLAYQKINDYNNSIKYAELAISKNPYHYGSHMLLGRAYFKTGNYREAENIYQKTLKLFPEKGDAYISLGAVYERQNRLEEALSILNIALTRKDTDAAKAYNTLGIIYWRLKKYQDSVNAAQQAIAINPGLLDAYLTLGLTYEDMGMQDLALAQFRKAWQQGYDMVATYNYWAINFMRQNDTGRAILYLQEALKLQPDHPESLKNLAEAYLLKNK